MKENQIKLYLVPCKHGNYARDHGQSIIVVQAKAGRKYLTVADKNHQLNGRKFDVEQDEDENGNKYHDEISEYKSDFCAYDTLEEAEEYLRRDVLLTYIKGFILDKVSLNTLQKISDALKENIRCAQRKHT